MKRILPSPRQLEFHAWERGLFLHFGIRTFYEGWCDFDERGMDPGQFNPSELDCGNWVATAKEAGFRYIVLTAKHHDGFALWPSKLTDFSVASSPWRNARGDVIREFTEACRRHDMRVGLYYSPFDASNPSYGDEKAYDDYFIMQIRELLEPYGPVDILWFDGCGSEGHTYDWPRIVGEIRAMQPDLLFFNMGDPAIRWIGNEEGYAPRGTSNIVDHVPFSICTGETQAVGRRWLCPECDCRMRERNWFYSDRDENTVKSLDELMGLYYYSCGRGANLLLNIGPDRRGLLPDPDARRLLEFGAEIRRRFEHPSATEADCTRAGTTWTFSSEERFPVNHLVVSEDLAYGEAITRFVIRTTHQDPIVLYEGTTVGNKAICAFPTAHLREIAFEVTEAEEEVRLKHLSFHYVR